MIGFLVRLAAVSAAVAAIWMWQRRRTPADVNQSDVAGGEVTPTQVMLPDEDDEADWQNRRRTGDNQELRRAVVHGPYRPIDDPGEPSSVQLPEEP